MSGWPTVKLDEVARRGSGHTPSKQHPEYWNGPIRWVSLRDTFRLDRGLIRETAATISEAGLSHSSAVLHPAGTVVLLRDAGIGKSAVLGSDMAVSQHFMAWVCGPKLDNWFLYYLLQARKEEFERISNGSTIKTIGLDYFRHLSVPLPPINEQREIAGMLSDADSLIDGLERLGIKRREVRQGALQELLSGNSRLPSHRGGWSLKSYGEIVKIQRGELFVGRDAIRNGSVPVIAAGKSPAAYTSKPNRRGPVITISSSGASAGFVGFHSEDIFASDCSTIEPSSGFDIRFIYYALAQCQNEIYRAQSGGAQPHIHARDIYPMKVALPDSVEEQRAIADIIEDFDQQLDVLDSRLAKARAIKTGMMQLLLAGRTRLVEKEAVA